MTPKKPRKTIRRHIEAISVDAGAALKRLDRFGDDQDGVTELRDRLRAIRVLCWDIETDLNSYCFPEEP